MEPDHADAAWQAGPGRQAGQRAGAVVRAARLGAGLTLAELGQCCGYSASQVSRFERGVQPLTDITLLRRFAAALQIPPHALGLAPLGAGAGRHADLGPQRVGAPAHGPNVSRESDERGGGDPVRRRELLQLAGAAALALPAARRAQPGGMDGLLYGGTPAGPVTPAELRAATTGARADFHLARYDRLAAGLPRLIATAMATRDGASWDARAAASTLLAEAYIVAANFMIKLNDDPLALTLADRALQAAQTGDDPLTAADARRAVATMLRRTGRRNSAREMLARATGDLQPGRHASADHLSMYGTLLEVAAYTAAADGNRSAARDLIAEAQATAARLGPRGDGRRFTAFGPGGVVLYQVSIAQVLGDSGTAIEHARTLRAADIPTAERRGRYWIDVARAYHQWGKPGPCYRALLRAEQAAPGEVRYRPPVHRITEDLLRAGPRLALPGLPGFACRIGVPTA